MQLFSVIFYVWYSTKYGQQFRVQPLGGSIGSQNHQTLKNIYWG